MRLPGSDPPDAPRVVVPVPTTKARRRARGYNQAGLLARAFAGARALPVVGALRRVAGGRTQVALHPEQRRRNVAGAFRTVEALRMRVRGVYVVLVDDVLTTGATASAAAGALEHAGAAGVTLVTYARALPYRRG